MQTSRLVAVAAITLMGAAGAPRVREDAAARSIPGDSDRGAKLFESEGCVQCHSISGKGGTVAPDLGKVIDRNFTPTIMAALMWNHAPAMWDAMRKRGVAKSTLSLESAADLFAFFYSTRFFDRPGDAARGKQAFSSHHCSDCHGIGTSKFEGAKPVTQWESLGHPIILAQQMWDHSAKMKAAFDKKGIPWGQLTSQELSDILVYLRNLPETRDVSRRFSTTTGENGAALFQSKGCIQCHTGKLALEGRLRNRTLTDIAVEMWNHAPMMMQPPPTLDQDEMRHIVSYIWARQFFTPAGKAARGKRVFTGKRCADCHNDPSSGAPNLAAQKGNYSDLFMVSALWQHGPRMLQHLNEKKIAWPRLTGEQMADLIAYLNAL